MKFKRYCVTVMDNWTPTREFWTFGAALRHAAAHLSAAHLHVWNNRLKTWDEIQRVWLRNIHDR
jgi:hypothetical protein